jgi:hypothetical protein
LSKVLTKLNKPPRGIDQSTILQHTFTFCKPWECFEKFRLVAKIWKFSVEQTKFYHLDRWDLESVLSAIEVYKVPFPPIYHKFFQNVKVINLVIDQELFFQYHDQISGLILGNVSNLRSIHIHWWEEEMDPYQLKIYQTFTFKLLEISNKYIQTLKAPSFVKLPQKEFLNLSEISFSIFEMPLSTFKEKLNDILKSCPYIKIINLCDCDCMTKNVHNFILQNYAEYAILSKGPELPPLPVKIQEGPTEMLNPANSECQIKFFDEINYLKIYLDKPEMYGNVIDVDLQAILNAFPNVKGITFCDNDDNELGKEIFLIPGNKYSLTKAENTLWENRFSELTSRSIKILTNRELIECEKELSKHLPWRFRFLL